MSASGRSLTSVSARVSVASALGQLPGFLIPLLIAQVLGATPETDAFFLVLAVATVLINVVTASVQHAGVPFFVASGAATVGKGDAFLGRVLAAVGVLSVAATLAVSVLLPIFAGDRTATVSSASLRLFSLLLLPYVLMAGISAVWSAVLNADGAYVAAAASPALRGAIILGFIAAWCPRWGVLAVAAGYVLGEAARSVFLWKVADRFPAWRTTATSTLGRQFSRNAAAQGLGSLIVGAVVVLDRFFAAGLGAGRVTLLEYADRIFQVPMSLAMSGFLVASVGEWSRRLNNGADATDVRQAAHAAVRSLVPLVAASSLVLLFTRHAVIGLLFSRSNLQDADLQVLADTLGAFVIGAPFYVAGLVYTRPFLVLRRSEWLLAFSVVQFALKWTLNATLAPRLGVPGIALATTLVYLTTACGFWLTLRYLPPASAVESTERSFNEQ